MTRTISIALSAAMLALVPASATAAQSLTPESVGHSRALEVPDADVRPGDPDVLKAAPTSSA